MIKLPGDETRLLYSNYEGCFGVPVPNWVQSSIPKEDILSLLYDSLNKEKPLPDRREDFEGKVESFFNYDTGQLEKTGNWERGKKQGLWSWYFPDGSIKYVGNYVDGVLEGVYESYWDKSEHQNTLKNVPDDPQISFLYKRGVLVNGKPHGKWETFYLEQELKVSETQEYFEGYEKGLYEFFYNNGQPGERNGQLGERGKHEREVKYGLWEYFYHWGQIEKRGHYKDNKKIGVWEYFDEEGNLTKTEEWKDGKLLHSH